MTISRDAPIPTRSASRSVRHRDLVLLDNLSPARNFACKKGAKLFRARQAVDKALLGQALLHRRLLERRGHEPVQPRNDLARRLGGREHSHQVSAATPDTPRSPTV